MPQHVPWEAALAADQEPTDTEHRALLEHCETLAALCLAEDGSAEAARFDETLAALRDQVHRHLEAEAARLADGADADALAGELADEAEDFESLIGDAALPGQFSRLELQRFLALWCLGHVRASAARIRALSNEK